MKIKKFETRFLISLNVLSLFEFIASFLQKYRKLHVHVWSAEYYSSENAFSNQQVADAYHICQY